MHSLLIPIGLVVSVIIASLAALSRKGGNFNGGVRLLYRKKQLMTSTELEFFGRLRVALPEHYIFPQVAQSALMVPRSSGKQAMGARNRISQKIFDYVIFTQTMDLVAVIEFDDHTHNIAKDRLRDAAVASAEIRTVRFDARNKPNVAQISHAVLGTSSVVAAATRAVL